MANETTEEQRPMRGFRLRRLIDKKGVSGLGIVAEGCLFTNGWVVLRWTGEKNGITSISWFPSYDQMCRAHGHGGDTEVVWLRPEESPATPAYQSEYSIDALHNRIIKLIAHHTRHILKPNDKTTKDDDTIASEMMATIIAAEERAYHAGRSDANKENASWPPKKYGTARYPKGIKAFVLDLVNKLR